MTAPPELTANPPPLPKLQLKTADDLARGYVTLLGYAGVCRVRSQSQADFIKLVTGVDISLGLAE